MAATSLNSVVCAGHACPLCSGELGTCLKRIGIFRDLTDAQARLLRRSARSFQVGEEHELFAAGDPAREILLVVRGLVKVVRSDATGRQHIIRLLRTGDHFGSEYLFSAETMPVAAIAVTEGNVCFVPLTAVEDLVAADAALATRIITAMARQLRQAEENAAKLALADAGSRLAALLLDLGGEIGRPAGPGRLHIRLPINRPDLASLVGIAPETVSRRLAELAAAGVVLLHGHRGITVTNRQRLAALAGRDGE